MAAQEIGLPIVPRFRGEVGDLLLVIHRRRGMENDVEAAELVLRHGHGLGDVLFVSDVAGAEIDRGGKPLFQLRAFGCLDVANDDFRPLGNVHLDDAQGDSRHAPGDDRDLSDKRPMMSFPRKDGSQCLHALPPVPDDGRRLAGHALRLVFAHHIEHHAVRAGVSKFLDPFADVCSASPGHDGVDQPIAAALVPVRGLEAGLGNAV